MTTPESFVIARQRFEQSLKKHLTPYLPDTSFQNTITYAIKKGKRLRPALIYALGDDLQLPHNEIDALAVLIESIHAYSLVHDDLPAMDDSDFRRGEPACHKIFGQAQALLCGSWLQNHAFTLLSTLRFPNPKKAMAKITSTIGNQGLILGQSMEFEHLLSHTFCENTLLKIAQLKTGALFRLCFTLPLMLRENYESHQQKFEQLGQKLGLIFQIQDDLEDFEQDKKTTQSHKNIAVAMGQKKALAHLKKTNTEMLEIMTTIQPSTHRLNKIIHHMTSATFKQPK